MRAQAALLAEAGMEGTDDGVILRGQSGYRHNLGLTQDDPVHQTPWKTKEEPGESPADRAAGSSGS